MSLGVRGSGIDCGEIENRSLPPHPSFCPCLTPCRKTETRPKKCESSPDRPPGAGPPGPRPGRLSPIRGGKPAAASAKSRQPHSHEGEDFACLTKLDQTEGPDRLSSFPARALPRLGGPPRPSLARPATSQAFVQAQGFRVEGDRNRASVA